MLSSQKITFFGSSNVGKTSLIHRYAYNKIISDHSPTLEDTYNISVKSNDRNALIEVTDTAGLDEYNDLRDANFLNTDIAVYVYSVVDKESFYGAERDIQHFFNVLEQNGVSRRCPMLLVGNKVDMDNRVVTKQDIENLVQKIQLTCLVSCLEVSIHDDKSVNDLFEIIAFGFNKNALVNKEIDTNSSPLTSPRDKTPRNKTSRDKNVAIDTKQVKKLTFKKAISMCLRSPRKMEN
ncbi:Sphingomyelin phosphodiesterase [Entamoeba marina]